MTGFIDLNDFPVLEVREVLDNLDYDLELYRSLIEMYLESYADYGDILAEKMAGDDLNDILSTAHTLKGIVANIGGERLAESARQIMGMCREGIKPDSGIWAPVVKAQTAELKNALEHLDWSDMERVAVEAAN